MKKKIIIGSLVFSVPLIFLMLFGNNPLCRGNADCGQRLHAFFVLFQPILPLFLFSLLTYRLPERYFRAWSRFALVWIPLSMLAIACSPEYGDSIMPIYSITKGFVSYLASTSFAIISTLILFFVFSIKFIKQKPRA